MIPTVSAQGVKKFVNRQVGLDEEDDDILQLQGPGGSQPQKGYAFDTLCALGNFSTVVLQWAQGANINSPDDQAGASPLMWACFKGHLNIVKFLIDRGAEVNFQSSDGQTALMWAAVGNSVEIGIALLDAGADAFISDARGYTPAVVSIQHQSLAFLHMLHLRHCTDPTHKDSEGHTLLAWASYLGNVAIAQYCVDILGVTPEAVDKVKRTPLHWAAREGRADCCVYLLSIGLSPSVADDDGITPLGYAETRNHRAASRVLTQQEKTPINHAVGTLTLIGNARGDRMHLYHALASIFYMVIYWFASLIIPPVFITSGIVCYFMKNMLHATLLRTPVMNSVPRESIMEEIGAPKSLMGAIRGHKEHRRRDVANICAFFTFIGIQYFTLSTIGGFQLPTTYLVLTALVLICAIICKHSAYTSVIPPGTLKDDPTLKAVERGECTSIRYPRVYDTQQHLRIPLRAFYCIEADRVFQRFDGWSQLLDCPIANSNHRSFILTLILFAMQQILLFFTSYHHFTENFCPRGITVGGYDDEANGFSIIRLLYNFVFSALPCPAPLHSKSWYDWIVPSSSNTAGVWLVLFSGIAAITMLAVIMRQLVGVMRGSTRAELADPVALGTNGEMVPIMKKGETCVFSDGGPTANLFLFCAGQQGERWKGVPAIPAPVGAGSIAIQPPTSTLED